jgi:hypothetical protein
MANNSNGYIGVNGGWSGITSRSIGVDNQWKDQTFQYVGDNGYWRLTYTKNPIDLGGNFFVRYLEGYEVVTGNSLTIYGSNLVGNQVMFPADGGYFELTNLSDLYGNFAGGTLVGTPSIGQLFGGQPALGITTNNDYFNLPSDLDAIGIFGNDGNRNYNLGSYFYLNTLPSGSTVTPVLSYGNAANGMEVVVTSGGNLQQKIYTGSSPLLIDSGSGKIKVGWNSFLINRTTGTTKMYLSGTTTAVTTSSLVTITPSLNNLVRVGASFTSGSTTPISPAMSTTRTAPAYALSNNNLTITSSDVNYYTSRSNMVISRNTGKYYIEVFINAVGSGWQWLGLGSTSDSVTNGNGVGLLTWSITSSSRTFNKDNGVVWGGGANTFTTDDIVGCIYDSNAGSLTWYRNNVLLGTSTTAVIGDTEFIFSSDTGGSDTMRFTSGSWTYAPPVAGAIAFPPATVIVAGTVYSTIGTGYKYVYWKLQELTPINLSKYLNRGNTKIIFKNKTTLAESIVPSNWLLNSTNEYISFTVPPNVTEGIYDVLLRYSDIEESYGLPVTVNKPVIATTEFIDDFSDETTLKNNYLFSNTAWGGANGGVVPDNVFLRDGVLILKGNGDNYTGTTQGVDGNGLKFHTNPSDPQFGLPWTNRVGGVISYNKLTGYGSYEVNALIPNVLGVSYAFWTFFYNEIYLDDPRYNEYLAEGLSPQGVSNYIARNHEIDIEFPSHLTGGTYNNPSLNNMKCNTWIGELSAENTIALTPVGFNIADGNYHKIRFDWYPTRVDYYVDDVLKNSVTKTIPNIAGYFTFGSWFPSSPLTAKPWLADPENAWAGGTVTADGGMKANFGSVELKVKGFKFTPFSGFTAQQRVLGVTYPFGDYIKP